MLMGFNLHNQQHSASPGEGTRGTGRWRERKQVQAVISGGKLGKNMYSIWSWPMKLAGMSLNIHLVVFFHYNEEWNRLLKLLFCRKRSWVQWVITQGELPVCTFFFFCCFGKQSVKNDRKKWLKMKKQDVIFF